MRTLRTLRMLSGLAAQLKGWLISDKAQAGRETDRDRRAAEALAAMRDANDAMAALGAASAGAAVATGGFGDACASLGGCYHDAVAYSLGYEASPGVIELCGETFTNLDIGMDGGARAALRRHRQNYDPDRDVERLIVALKPVGVVGGRKEDGDAIEAYGLPPGPLAGNPVTAEVWGEHVASGRFDVVKRALEMVKRDCNRRGVDISKSKVTVSVKPHDGQEAFARCVKKACGVVDGACHD